MTDDPNPGGGCACIRIYGLGIFRGISSSDCSGLVLGGVFAVGLRGHKPKTFFAEITEN